MAAHRLETPATCDCYARQVHHCPICDGGLSVCLTCGAFEGGLASECPGRQLSSAEEELIYQGWIDFKDGKWVLTTRLDYPKLCPRLGLVRPETESCEACKENQGVPILYGKLQAAGKKWVAEGKARAGGCVMDTNSPTHGCTKCPRTWIDKNSSQWEERQALFAFVAEVTKPKEKDKDPS